MNDNSAIMLIAAVFCLVFMGMLCLGAILVLVSWLRRKSKAASPAASQTPVTSKPSLPAKQALSSSLPHPASTAQATRPSETTGKAVPREIPSSTSEPDLCEKYLQKARDEWKLIEKIDLERDRERLLKIASYLQLAIQNAKYPIPDTYGRMSLVMVFLSETKKAEYFSNIALGQQKHNVFGWLTKLTLAMIALVGHNPWYITSDFRSGEGALWSLLTLGIAIASKSSKVNAVRTAAQNLAWAFYETVRLDEDIDIDDWIIMGEMLLDIGDKLNQSGVNEPELYKAVFTAPWDRADLGKHRGQVEDLRARAQALHQLSLLPGS
ncbi:MAG: hypothetical protein FJ014_06965 [Chloroflexi bacterium]|nr:hypothetical protein [Chloroflexota bacterium]